ncbi:hypothetical protein V6N13_107178 [Hibiscus sabdariffa]|uniref:Uncharacterized protein n=1 Tax=Hibiscus sabdariffa TaxID=183260 RepID=A0ABR2F306_9ROSI
MFGDGAFSSDCITIGVEPPGRPLASRIASIGVSSTIIVSSTLHPFFCTGCNAGDTGEPWRSMVASASTIATSSDGPPPWLPESRPLTAGDTSTLCQRGELGSSMRKSIDKLYLGYIYVIH